MNHMFKRIMMKTVCSLLVAGALVSCQKEKVEAEPLPPDEIQLGKAIQLFKDIPHPAEYADEVNGIIEGITSSKDLFITDIKAVEEHDTDDLLLLIDKRNSVGEDFVPEDLVPLVKNSHYPISRTDLNLRVPVEEALVVMADAAKEEGVTLLVSSTYRSYAYQAKLFQRYVDRDGLAEAERYSAREGTSQHQLGVAIDFGSIDDSYAETKAGRWLDANAEKYGFSLSFPKAYEPVTGYMWECWHYRYIGDYAVAFQNNWFGDVQQYMIEFVDCWRKAGAAMAAESTAE